MKLITCILLFASFVKGEKSFSYNDTTFLLDGKPFQYLSGSIHYRRVPKEYWADRLKKIRALGFNTIQFYLEWNIHEREPGIFDFSGNADVEEFIQEASRQDLFVIVRLGPYIDGERDMGGLPYWLLRNKESPVKLRTHDPQFLNATDSWFATILPRLKKYLRSESGGPILMVQVENEYGSYGLATGNCDIIYLVHLRNTIRQHLGTKVLLFTTDGASLDYIRCGQIPDTLVTIDFGPSTPEHMSSALESGKVFRSKGPLINSEFYSGWLDHWGSKHSQTPAAYLAEALDWLLSQKVNLNMYMVHGGTSFGFEAGANSPSYEPNPTSYDYDSPISEAGDLTDKYYAIQSVVQKYFSPLPSLSVTNSTKGNYGKVTMTPVSNIFSLRDSLGRMTSFKYPLTFEDINQNHGYVLYETILPNKLYSSPILLQITGIHDRAYIYLNYEPLGILTTMFGNINSLPLVNVVGGQILSIFVENQGRSCFGTEMNQYKGIDGNVTLGSSILGPWNITGFPLPSLQKTILKTIQRKKNDVRVKEIHDKSILLSQTQMSFWKGSFKVSCSEGPHDTFLKLSLWKKGVAFINDFNLGRYWPSLGPQETLYVPGSLLKPCQEDNIIVLFEQDGVVFNDKNGVEFVEFVKEHVLDGPVP